jgi:hypothetical protein
LPILEDQYDEAIGAAVYFVPAVLRPNTCFVKGLRRLKKEALLLQPYVCVPES